MDVYAVGILVLCGVLQISGQQQTLTFCSDVTVINQTEVLLSFRSAETFSKHRQCSCRIDAITSSAFLQVSSLFIRPSYFGVSNNKKQQTYGQDQGYGGPDDGEESGNSTCNPFVSMMLTGRAPLHQCTGRSRNHTKLYVSMQKGERLALSMHNHRLVDIEADLVISAESGVVSVVCERRALPVQVEVCPCGFPGMYAGHRYRPGDDVSTTFRITVAFVCVAVLILIIAVIVGIWWWRRKRQAGEKDLQVVPPGGTATENQGYAPSTNVSRASGLDRAPDGGGHSNGPDKNRNVPVEQDPELNLDLRSPPTNFKPQAKGSHDSGLYSLPFDKHIRPNNNMAPYQNVPTTIGPDQMYNPMGPSQSSSSLTGQGALHGSIDQLSPADIDALYAKPNKPGRRMPPPSSAAPPTRSASQDALHTRPDEYDTSMRSMGTKSLNGSQPAVETDV